MYNHLHLGFIETRFTTSTHEIIESLTVRQRNFNVVMMCVDTSVYTISPNVIFLIISLIEKYDKII